MLPAMLLPALEQIFTVSLQFSTNSSYRPILGMCVCFCCLCVCVCVHVCVDYVCSLSHDMASYNVMLQYYDAISFFRYTCSIFILTSKKGDDSGELL